jgi:alpha,alpha-trehalase
MLLEIARFWASLASEGDDGRHDIRGVMGPDEYHDAYPGARTPGIDNNAYTNVMASWTLRRALGLEGELTPDRWAELRAALEIGDAELERWDRVSRTLRVPFHDGLISQFEGYGALAEFDWEGYRARYRDIHRLDRILEDEGDTPNRYKLSKQADVLMLFFLFSAEELRDLFGHLGYDFDPATIPRTIEYYNARTSHGSTLSRVVHSWVLARSDREGSWRLFCEALESDIGDIQGGTTAEGIHLGAMAGTVDLLQACYTGIEIRDHVLWLNPRLPDAVSGIAMRLHFRGQALALRVSREAIEVDVPPSERRPVRVGIRGRVHTLEPGARHSFEP